MTTVKKTRTILTMLMLVVLLAPAATVGAQPPVPECVHTHQAGYFEVCFLGVTYDGNTSTWTYSVTAQGVPHALSHWTLELCDPAVDDVVEPVLDAEGKGMYTTFSPFGPVIGREGVVYAVEVGPDGSGTDVTGIKFEDAVPDGLGENGRNETDIFQFTLGDDYGVTGVLVGTKAGSIQGGGIGTAYISGPDCGPTAAALSSVGARAGVSSVTLAWETGTEMDTAGFNLYRATALDGVYTKINNALIAAQGDATTGASYSFLDKGISAGTYYYKLEEVTLNGATTQYALGAAQVLPSLRKPAYRPTAPR